MCNNPHGRWEKRRDCVTAQKAQPGAPFSKRYGALGHEKEKEKEKKNTLRLEAGVKCHRQVHQKKNHQGRKLSMDSSFPAISALQPRCASAVTVTICWSKFPRVRRNDGIPPMHRYLRSPG